MPSKFHRRLPWVRLIASGVIASLTLAAVTIASAALVPYNWNPDHCVDQDAPDGALYYFRDDTALRTRLFGLAPTAEQRSHQEYASRPLPQWSQLAQERPHLITGEIASGWPLRCAYSSEQDVPAKERAAGPGEIRGGVRLPNVIVALTPAQNAMGPLDRIIPVTPLPLPLVANLTLYFIVAFLLLSIPVWTRRGIRSLRGKCPRCAYALEGIESSNCPECGHPIRPEKPRTA